MSDVTTRGKPLTAAEHSAGVLACEILRAEYEGDAIELLVEMAEAGLALAGSAAISVPAGREGVRRSAARLVDRLGVSERDAMWRDRASRAEAVALAGEVG